MCIAAVCRHRGPVGSAPSFGTILASWQNQTSAGAFSEENPSAISYPNVGGERIARFTVVTAGGDNANEAFLYFDVPSSRMQDGNVLHLAWEMKIPEATMESIATNLGAPYQQIKFHLSRAQDDPPKWGPQSYRYAVVAMGVATQGESAPDKIRTLNDWFNLPYSPSKDSATVVPDTSVKVQLAYREDATNAYVRVWYNGVEAGEESLSNDNTGDGGSNNNGGSEGQDLTYRMRFGIGYAATHTAGETVSLDIRRIIVSTAFQEGF